MQIVFARPPSESTVLIHSFIRDTCHVEHLSSTDLDTFVRAFTTAGYGKDNRIGNYERLEFLGDAFIHYRVSRKVFDMFPSWNEGKMTKLCDHLWNNRVYPEKLYDSDIDLVSLLMIPASVENQSPKNIIAYITSATSDCFESLIGALDVTGNSNEAGRIVDIVLLNRIDKITSALEKRPITEWDDVLNERARMQEDKFKKRILEVISDPE